MSVAQAPAAPVDAPESSDAPQPPGDAAEAPLSGRVATVLLGGSMLVMGACGIIYEYVLSVLGNYLLGSGHEEIFIIIGLMMFAMGIGAVVQRQMRGGLVDGFLVIEGVLGLVGGISAIAVHSVFAVSESYRIVLYLFAGAIGVLIGMEIPVLIRINREYASSLRTNLSQILSMDYAGSLVGALLFAFVLLTNVTLARIGFILGLTNVAVAVVGLIVLRRHVERPRTIAAFFLATTAVLVGGFAMAPDWTAWAEQRYFRDPIVHRETSPYQHIVITERGDRVGLYLNGHLQFSNVDEAIYHEMLVHPVMATAPRRARVLILGGGDGLALREVLRWPDVEEVTLVDLDPAVTRLAATHPALVEANGGALADERVTVRTAPVAPADETETAAVRSQRDTELLDRETHPVAEVHVLNLDADGFLAEAEGSFDVAILDFPDPKQLELAKLFSREFYRTLLARLAPDATIALQATSPFHAKRVFLCIGVTLEAAGFDAVPYRQTVPSFGPWGFWLAKPASAAGPAALRNELRAGVALPVPTTFVTSEVIAAATVFGKGALVADPPVEPNSKLDPVIVRYFREAWRHY